MTQAAEGGRYHKPCRWGLITNAVAYAVLAFAIAAITDVGGCI
jgi:hypothetical protein